MMAFNMYFLMASVMPRAFHINVLWFLICCKEKKVYHEKRNYLKSTQAIFWLGIVSKNVIFTIREQLPVINCTKLVHSVVYCLVHSITIV